MPKCVKILLKYRKKYAKINNPICYADEHIELVKCSNGKSTRYTLNIQLFTNSFKIEPKSEKYNFLCGSKRFKNMESVLNGLEKRNASIYSATNYLIELFCKTNNTYSCDTTKIGKLLSIVAFIYAKNNIQLFEENIITYDCGTGFSELSYKYTMMELYSIGTTKEQQKKADSDEIVLSRDMFTTELSKEEPILKEYPYTKGSLSEDVVRVLEDVFIRFGAWPARTLGIGIDTFKDRITISQTEKIGNELVQQYFNEDLRTNENSIYCFIKNYKLDLNNGNI